MFFLIHEEIEPQRAIINCGFLLKCMSQAVFNWPKNRESFPSIHEISSSTISICPSWVCLERCQNRSPQLSDLTPGIPALWSWSAKISR
ncbi:MAG: hypothetical protein EBZ47_02865 [Chlamydiae bacterium]|nr:hypothetical protein [Chlamydiota bacterium]